MVIEYDFRNKKKITRCEICNQPSEKKICEKCEIDLIIEQENRRLMR